MENYNNILNCKSTSVSGYPSFSIERPRWTVEFVTDNKPFDAHFYINNKYKKVQYRLNDIVVSKIE